MKSYDSVIIRPVITESSMDGLADRKYTFEVARDATKIDIARAVEEAFKVKVEKVNTISMRGRNKRVGVHRGRTSEWKKAIVKLTADSKTIEFFDGLR